MHDFLLLTAPLAKARRVRSFRSAYQRAAHLLCQRSPRLAKASAAAVRDSTVQSERASRHRTSRSETPAPRTPRSPVTRLNNFSMLFLSPLHPAPCHAVGKGLIPSIPGFRWDPSFTPTFLNILVRLVRPGLFCFSDAPL